MSARVRIVRLTLATLDTLKCNYALGNEFCAQLPGIFMSEDVLIPQMRRIAFCNAFKNDDNATRVFQSMGRATAFKSVRELYVYLTTSVDDGGLSSLKFYAEDGCLTRP